MTCIPCCRSTPSQTPQPAFPKKNMPTPQELMNAQRKKIIFKIQQRLPPQPPRCSLLQPWRAIQLRHYVNQAKNIDTYFPEQDRIPTKAYKQNCARLRGWVAIQVRDSDKLELLNT